MSAPGPTGAGDSITAEVHGDRATLVLRRHLRHPPARVWEALTDPAQLERWYLTQVRSEGRAGGTIEMTTELSGVRSTGRILLWEPPRVLEYEWNVGNTGHPVFHGQRTVVRWELTPTVEGTLLVLTHRDLTRPLADAFHRGFPLLVDRLEAHLEGRTLPTEWEDRIREARRRGWTAEAPGGPGTG